MLSKYIKPALFFILLLVQGVSFAQGGNASKPSINDPYVCIPCGSDCDKEKFDQPG
jgi:hypothetical protein